MVHMFEGAREEFKTSIPRSVRVRHRVAVESRFAPLLCHLRGGEPGQNERAREKKMLQPPGIEPGSVYRRRGALPSVSNSLDV